MLSTLADLSTRAQRILHRFEVTDDGSLLRWWSPNPDRAMAKLDGSKGCGERTIACIHDLADSLLAAKVEDGKGPSAECSATISPLDGNFAVIGGIEAIKKDAHEVFKDLECCRLCRFWDGKGLCRRYPRGVSVDANGWCGEYRVKEPA